MSASPFSSRAAMNISAAPIAQESLRTPWQVEPHHDMSCHAMSWVGIVAKARHAMSCHATTGLVMSSARRFRSGRESGTFRIWPFGKLRPMGAGQSLPWRLNSGILRRPEVLGFTTSTWTPDFHVLTLNWRLSRSAGSSPAPCNMRIGRIWRRSTGYLCYITDLVYASATRTLQ